MFQNIISQCEQKFASEHLRRNKRKNERWKENHRRKANYFIGKYALGKILYCIHKNFKMRDKSITRGSRNDQESGCL